jgi:hypothetical protein
MIGRKSPDSGFGISIFILCYSIVHRGEKHHNQETGRRIAEETVYRLVR